MTRKTHFQIGFAGWVYFISTGLLWVAAVYTQANLLFWALGLMLGATVMAVLISWLSMRGAYVERISPQHAIACQPLTLRYRLENRNRWLPLFNLVVKEAPQTQQANSFVHHSKRKELRSNLSNEPSAWVLHVGPQQSLQTQLSLTPQHRGKLVLDRVVLVTSFPFGVLRRVCEFDQKNQVLIYPRLFRLKQSIWHQLATTDPAGHARANYGGGDQEFFGLRRYRIGDSPRSIDWRHTAKIGLLIAKEYTRPESPKLQIILDLSTQTDNPILQPQSLANQSTATPSNTKSNLPPASSADSLPKNPIEHAISLAASLAWEASNRGYQVGLFVNGIPSRAIRPRQGPLHLERLMESLALLDVSHPQPSTTWLHNQASIFIRPGSNEHIQISEQCPVV